ncbi:MAG: SDR family NAD(P)-dependent oxidoreductase [Chloroflexi bacterium]|nr:MAG: SDR family NAD(P)-dependent oxidoreductase [Chloroflexota bacterium]
MSKPAVLVTGASTGIGRACALELDRAGYRVFAGVRRQEDGRALAEAASSRLVDVMLDVTDGASIDAAAELIAAQLGDARFLGVVNNAGIAVGGPAEFIALDGWRRQLEVNVIGQVAVVQRFLAMIRAHGGRIVNISSVGGRVSQPFVAPYVASKHAVEAISDALRMELRPWGIEVCLIEPGSVATPLWEKSTRAAVEALSGSAPQQVFELYGRAVEAITKVVRRQEEMGVPPERVALAVLHALTARRPKTRYVVGRDAQMLLLLRRILPDRWRDELILRYAGLPRDAAAVTGANGTAATDVTARATSNGRRSRLTSTAGNR